MNCFLSTYLIQMANQYVLNLEEEPDKKLKKSYLRLSKNTQELQKSLNDMFSL